MEFDQKIRSIIKHGGLSRALEIYGERRAKGWSLRSFTYSWPKKIFLRPLTRIAPVDHFLIPHITPPKAYGGIATLLHLAIERVRSGRQVHVILFDEKGKLDDLPLIAQLNPTEWSALRSRFSLSDASSSSEIVIDAGPDDQYIASAWWTKFSLDHAIPSLKPHQLIYIIQDDESLFYDKSDAIENELSHMARSSLAGSYHAIINSDFLADYFLNQSLLSRNTLQSLRIISPLIDHQLFFNDGKLKEKILLVYARPEVKRNRFDLCVSSLSELAPQLSPEWQILGLGSLKRDVYLGSGHFLKSVGKLPYVEYAALCRRSAVALCLMECPHPSYPPLELGACGAQVVCNRFANKDYSVLGSQYICCNLDTEELAGALATAVHRCEAYRNE